MTTLVAAVAITVTLIAVPDIDPADSIGPTRVIKAIAGIAAETGAILVQAARITRAIVALIAVSRVGSRRGEAQRDRRCGNGHASDVIDIHG